MKIANLNFDNPVFLAPMAGVTDIAYRGICKDMGCNLVYTEMVSAKGLYYDSKNTAALMRISNEEKPVALQIFGSDPKIMAHACEVIDTIDGVCIIDINMGCPTPKIVKNGDGSALMLKPKLVGEIVRRVSDAINLPLTVKIRKGWDKNSVNAEEIAYIVQENGAAAIAVHGRTREQLYGGTADWDIIAQIKKNLSIPVIGNGDIFTPEDAVCMLEKTGCDAVMIGRGARGNPWIFSRTLKLISQGENAPHPDIRQVLRMIERHTDLSIEQKGEKLTLKEMRKHVGWYLKGFRNAGTIRKEANRAETRQQLFQILKDYEDQM